MKKPLSYFFFSLLLLLYSCDVELHDNFVDIEPLPTETPIYVDFDTKTDEEGALEIFEHIPISYQISTPEANFLRASFYVNDMQIGETAVMEGTLHPSFYPLPKEFQLRCVVYAEPKEPGHSISDQTNERLYVGEIRWNVHVVTPELRFYQNPGDITLENITVRWEVNVPNCSFKVNYNGTTIASKTEETSITLPTPAFGQSLSLNIEVFNQNGDNIYIPYETTNFPVTFGTFLKGSQMRSIYSPYSNTLYTSMYREVTSHSIPELAILNEYKNENSSGGYATPLAVAPNSGKIAVSYEYFIRIFTYDLKQQIKIYNPDEEYMPYKAILTADDKLAVFYNSYSPIIYLYDANNGELEKSISIDTPPLNEYYPDYGNIQVSENFLCVPLLTTNKIAIVPLEDFQISEPIKMYDCAFNKIFIEPNSPDKLIIDKTDQVDIIDCRNSQILQSVPKKANWIFYNVDPKTGNFLFQSNHYLIITDKFGKELLQLEKEYMVFAPHLDNHILTCENGIALNVEPYLKKK